MNVEKLLRKMATEPVQTEQRLQRVILRTLAPRLLIGFVVYGLWKWLLFSQFHFEFGGFQWLIDDIGVAGIIYATLRPLFVILRMDDDKMDRLIPDDP